MKVEEKIQAAACTVIVGGLEVEVKEEVEEEEVLAGLPRENVCLVFGGVDDDVGVGAFEELAACEVLEGPWARCCPRPGLLAAGEGVGGACRSVAAAPSLRQGAGRGRPTSRKLLSLQF